jgi:hypothetical protein
MPTATGTADPLRARSDAGEFGFPGDGGFARAAQLVPPVTNSSTEATHAVVRTSIRVDPERRDMGASRHA